MTDNTQSEALRLAEWCDANSAGIYRKSAELLREQHARIAELEAQIEAIGAGGVSPLIGQQTRDSFTAADMETASAQGFRDGVASDAELYPLIEKHFGMVPRRDDTVIDRRTGRYHDAQRYRDFAADLLSARAQPTPPAVVEPTELSPDFTDTARDGDDQFSQTRLAIVRAAAEIGRAMP